MRVPSLLAGFLLATSLFCSGNDQSATMPDESLVAPSGGTGFLIAPQEDNRRFPEAIRKRMKAMRRDDNVCYMLRTYVMVRESRDSDVTRRDGYFVCQPAWKFEVRSAVGTGQDR